jgi:hypothetical protein
MGTGRNLEDIKVEKDRAMRKVDDGWWMSLY